MGDCNFNNKDLPIFSTSVPGSVRMAFFILLICFVCCSERRNKTLSDQVFNLPMARSPVETPSNQVVKLETHSLLQPVVGEGKAKQTRGRDLCEGACVSQRVCDYHGGSSKGYCVNGNVCCKFERSCRGISKEKISFFQSPMYPNFLNESLECHYSIYPSEDVCAVRVDYLDMHIHKAIRYPKTEKCIVDSLYFLNTLNGPNEALCEMENYTSILYVDKHSMKPVVILFVLQSTKYRWKLKITQINCKTLTPWKNEEGCGRQLMFEPSEEDNTGELNSVNISSDLTYQQSPFIVNGKDADGREFPWQISLQVTSKHRCGGTILNDKYVLTAAHCVMGKAYESNLSNLKVIVGDLILNTTDDGKHVEMDVESVIVNFHYKTFQSYINDIAIVKVKGTIEFTPSIQPICLPPKEKFITDNREAQISGWGRLNGTAPNSPDAKAYRLQKLTVKVLTDPECREAVRKEISFIMNKTIAYNNTQKYAQLGINKSQLCAMAKINSTVCFGDSGGGLVMQNEEDGRYFQIGVVSYGLGQCVVTRITPVAYTRVTEYLDFIAMATST